MAQSDSKGTKFKAKASKFSSGSSKFLAKTPTGSDNLGSTPRTGRFASRATTDTTATNNQNNTNRNDNNNNNNNRDTNIDRNINNNSDMKPNINMDDSNIDNKMNDESMGMTMGMTMGGGGDMTYHEHSRRDRQQTFANTDFNESDGRDTRVLGTTHQLPLQYRWTLWHTAPKTKDQGWTNNFKQIASFDTVGTFWQLFNNIAPPTMLREGSSYHLFKGKVEPAWEDPFNKGGGSWTYRFPEFGGKSGGKRGGRGGRRGRGRDGGGRDNNSVISAQEGANIVNYGWYYTVLNMIGNNFNYNENICGIVISIRKNGRGKIELWIKNAYDRQSTDSIGYEFKQFSGAQKRNAQIVFISHSDNKKRNTQNSYSI